ncbi:putative peptidase [Selenomonas ruminantium subsp. lactilytica TAM6421]|uniref:Putative peptidase n=1 Tax=Selenomonas ruminantium subsp. lactilytica (strain NBRC 103574 / TAM6421) TaxID=927704 RepID=I0GSK6_SELRL|nr:putative peptidase [Selenomonas ruminantium subsp. lactilytica TAM6421]
MNQGTEQLLPETFSWQLCRQILCQWLLIMLIISAMFWKFEIEGMFLGLLFSALLVLIALLDCRYLLIFDRLVLALLLLGLLPLLLGRMSCEEACLGAALGGGFLGGLRLLYPRGMGWGDVKLAAALGGWLGLAGMLVCLYIAFIAGSLYGLGIWLKMRSVKNLVVPFGPFLVMGAIAAFAFGTHCQDLVEAWLCCP